MTGGEKEGRGEFARVTMTVNGEVLFHLFVGDGHIETGKDQGILNVRRDAINEAHRLSVEKAVNEERERNIKAVCQGCRDGWEINGECHRWPDDGIIRVGIFRCKAVALWSPK